MGSMHCKVQRGGYASFRFASCHCGTSDLVVELRQTDNTVQAMLAFRRCRHRVIEQQFSIRHGTREQHACALSAQVLAMLQGLTNLESDHLGGETHTNSRLSATRELLCMR